MAMADGGPSRETFHNFTGLTPSAVDFPVYRHFSEVATMFRESMVVPLVLSVLIGFNATASAFQPPSQKGGRLGDTLCKHCRTLGSDHWWLGR